jgi:hypothetical protein
MVRAIITGTTGMIGEGVLHECLRHPDVEQVLVISRRPGGVVHPKLREIIHSDFHDLASVESRLAGYNACFFCLGASSIGMNEESYKRVTYALTMHMAETLVRLNPGMTFCYVSGAGTDSTEKGRLMWARVKGKTENDLAKLPFKKAYMFRPGFIEPTKGLKNTLKLYRYVSWMIPIMKTFSTKYISSLQEIGLAMIHSVTKGYTSSVLEVQDIKALAKS